MKKPRLASLLLVLAITLSLTVPAAAASSLIPRQRTYTAPFADTKGTWCDAYVKTVYEAGLMGGKSANAFDPGGNLTYAQITVIVARLHNLLQGGDGVLPAPAAGAAWYQPAVQYLTEHLDRSTEGASYLLYNLYDLDLSADQPCDRYDFVWFLAAVLPSDALAPINNITALPDAADTDILRFYNAGILTGSDQYGTFNGYDELTRGQAAAMLARIADPALRVRFTPETLVVSQALLGLAPEETVLTVDGYAVTAEVYAFFLSKNIALAEMENYFSYYETYPEYYEAYWKDMEFDGTFSAFLLEKYGIDMDAPIDWNAPDKGGMSRGQKVREDTLADVKALAILMNHASSYPLTASQQAKLTDTLETYANLYYGYSSAFAKTMITSTFLQENLAAKHTLSAAQLGAYLAENGYVYGQYVVIYQGEERSWQYASDAEAREAANTVRRQMAAHLREPDYIEYLIWKYSDSYTTSPGLFSISELSAAGQTALKNLGINQVSGVLEEDGAYLVVLKLDPTQDSSMIASATSILAQTQLLEWAETASVSLTPAYNAVDVEKAAQVLDSLNA